MKRKKIFATINAINVKKINITPVLFVKPIDSLHKISMINMEFAIVKKMKLIIIINAKINLYYKQIQIYYLKFQFILTLLFK